MIDRKSSRSVLNRCPEKVSKLQIFSKLSFNPKLVLVSQAVKEGHLMPNQKLVIKAIFTSSHNTANSHLGCLYIALNMSFTRY